MALHGEELGIELASVYHAGHTLLPTAAGEYEAAFYATPVSISSLTSRPAGIGHDPGAAFNGLLDMLNDMTSQTAAALRGVGQSLVLAAGAISEADEAARRAFQTRQQDLGDL